MAQYEENAQTPVIDTQESSDEELAEAALAEPEAFAALYRRYRHRIYAYLLARARSADDAADLTQQTFLRAFDSLVQGRMARGDFAPWLFTIAHNVVVDYYRRRRTTVSWSLLPTPIEPAVDADPEGALTHREDLVRLRHVLGTLKAGQRELLALRFAARLTAREIALVVRKSPEATQKQIRRVLHTVKERYDADREW